VEHINGDMFEIVSRGDAILMKVGECVLHFVPTGIVGKGVRLTNNLYKLKGQ